MAKAKKLPSGSWRCLAYSHTEKVYDPKTGKMKDKRIYESFTSDDPTMQGKREAELAAALFQANKSRTPLNKRQDYGNMTLSEAIDKYISSSDAILSPTTINGYKIVSKNGFQSIMGIKLKDLSKEVLQDAVNNEMKQKTVGKGRGRNGQKTVSPKTVKNRYGLITAVINRYYPSIDCTVKLPQPNHKLRELPDPEQIINAFRGDKLELAVLLSIWLSFTMSEIRGLTKSKSIINEDYIAIREVVVCINGKDIRKENAKNYNRNRIHRMPKYLKQLIDQVEGDILVPYSVSSIYCHFQKILQKNHITQISFHDLRHLNASIMAMLHIPEKYALERGGWKTDKVMKEVYTHTFSNERKKADQIMDDFFNSMINTDSKRSSENLTLDEIVRILQSNDPDGWEQDLIEYMQHKMQHNSKEAL